MACNAICMAAYATWFDGGIGGGDYLVADVRPGAAAVVTADAVTRCDARGDATRGGEEGTTSGEKGSQVRRDEMRRGAEVAEEGRGCR